MKNNRPPARYQPKGFFILYEDNDIIVGEKSFGVLTVAAPYDRERTVHSYLNEYVRKGNSRSKKHVFVVHRLDRETSGIMIFAKTERAQIFLKDNWKETFKTYYAVVHGRLLQKNGRIESHLFEDDKYTVHSIDDPERGKLAITEYEVIRETPKFSLLKINLLTGRKNQIRVHMGEAGHPLVGDNKYGRPDTRYQRMALHSQSLSFIHPSTKQRINLESPLPEYFNSLMR